MATRPPMTPTSSSIDAARGRYIPWMIFAFFVCFTLLLSGFTWLAFVNKPSEVTRNAYQKGLAYNQTIAKDEKQKTLGWKSQSIINNGVLRFSLHDSAEKPVDGATVKAWLVHPANASLDRELMLAPRGNGIYEAPLSPPAKGMWDIHITAAQGDKQLQTSKSYKVE